MKNKKVWIGLAALVAAVCLMAMLYLTTREQAVEGAKSVTVSVIHKDQSQKDFHYKTNAQYLGELLLEEKLVEGENSEYGLMISAVDGETADWNVDQSYWALYIGEEYATSGADSTVLTDGGTYKLVYTIG